MYLEVKIEAFAEIDLLGEALVLAHVKGQSVITIGVLAFRQENGIVETHKFTSGHPLNEQQQNFNYKNIKKN